jgi:hypothetical protein
MSRYATPLSCGRVLAEDIASGVIDEANLLPAGRAKLKLWRESAEFQVAQMTDEDLSKIVDKFVIDRLGTLTYERVLAEIAYRAENRKPSVTELLLEDDDE